MNVAGDRFDMPREQINMIAGSNESRFEDNQFDRGWIESRLEDNAFAPAAIKIVAARPTIRRPDPA